MKKSWFKRKVGKPMKRGGLHVAGHSPTSVLKRKLWKRFSLFIRNRDKGVCFTCNRQCEGKGYHAGHFIPKSVGGIALYFNEDNVHGQCYNCNINLGGNQWEYGKRLGEEKVTKLMKLKQNITKWTEQDYLEKIKFYENILE